MQNTKMLRPTPKCIATIHNEIATEKQHYGQSHAQHKGDGNNAVDKANKS